MDFTFGNFHLLVAAIGELSGNVSHVLPRTSYPGSNGLHSLKLDLT